MNDKDLNEFIQKAKKFKYPKIKLNLYERYLLRNIQLTILRKPHTRATLCYQVWEHSRKRKGDNILFLARAERMVDKICVSFGEYSVYLNGYLYRTQQIPGRYLNPTQQRIIRICWIEKLTKIPVDWQEFILC